MTMPPYRSRSSGDARSGYDELEDIADERIAEEMKNRRMKRLTNLKGRYRSSRDSSSSESDDDSSSDEEASLPSSSSESEVEVKEDRWDEDDMSDMSDESSHGKHHHRDEEVYDDYVEEEERQEHFENRSVRQENFDNRSVYSSGGRSIAAQSLARAINNTKNKGGSRLSMQANLAMQRRKKESPKLLAQTMENLDVDYADGATELYKHIENHRWREAAERCRSAPDETKIWVFRMDKRRKNNLWRMLPIHTAILYRAPVYVILNLIEANPDGPTSVDDRQMLPVHMACRVICKEDVLRVLLKHKPETVATKDAKGRTAKDFLMDETRDQESKALKKVAKRNRMNLLKVLKEYEVIYERMISAPSVAGSRWSSHDDRSIASGRGRFPSDEQSVSSRYSRRVHSRPDSRGSMRSSSRGSVRSSSRGSVRSSSRGSVRSSSRGSVRSSSRGGVRPSSRGSVKSSSRGRERPGSRDSRGGRSQATSRSQSSRRDGRSVSRSRADERPSSRARSVRPDSRSRERIPRPGRAPEDGMGRRAPRLPTGPPGRAPRAPSVTRGRGRADDDEHGSVRSRSSRVSRRLRGSSPRDSDDDDWSRGSRISKAARGYDDDSVAERSMASRRSTRVSRVVRKPRGMVEEPKEINVEEIKIEESAEDAEAEDAEADEESVVSGDESEEHIEDDLPDGPLYELWKDIEDLYPIPLETFDPKLIQENERKLEAKRLAREEAIKNMKFYDPPKELQKLLAVIENVDSEEQIELQNNKKGKGSRAPLPKNGAARRVNACGALRALAKNAKNRLRLGRTKGVISALLSVLRDEDATQEERARCSNTLMFLSVPKQNCEAIFNSDPYLLSTLVTGLNDEDSRVKYNCSYCLFLFSKSEENRVEIVSNDDLVDTMVDMADIGLEEENEDDDISVDGSISRRFANLGSPSGIRQQGAPTTDEETKRGCRLNSMKVFLAISKSKSGASKMACNKTLMELLTKIAGTMTAEENTLCMAIFTNLTRNVENMNDLLQLSDLVEAVGRGLDSRNEECRKCATLTLQNLSCNKTFRRRIGSTPKSLPGLASQLLNNSDTKAAAESQISALHAMRNLSTEPSNVPTLMGTPGLTAGVMIAATNEKRELARYVACDTLAAMSQWLDSVTDTCIEKSGIDLKGRTLASMRRSTWKAWD